jgi:glucose/arabinose dehydrogenase
MTKLKRKALQMSLSIALVVVALSQALFAASPTVETLAHGLETPWAIDFAADGRAFVTERTGPCTPPSMVPADSKVVAKIK